jgi:hypothetical protein
MLAKQINASNADITAIHFEAKRRRCSGIIINAGPATTNGQMSGPPLVMMNAQNVRLVIARQCGAFR